MKVSRMTRMSPLKSRELIWLEVYFRQHLHLQILEDSFIKGRERRIIIWSEIRMPEFSRREVDSNSM